MSKIIDFYLEFNSKWGIYQPGDEVSGKVVINLSDSILCDMIELLFYGSARVFWIERKMFDGRFQPVTYRQEEVYMNEKRTIWEADFEEGVTNRPKRPMGALQLFTHGGRLSKGKHTFKFTYVLPVDLPTSFEATGVPAYVRYFAKASLFSSGCARVSKKMPFCVCSTVDLPESYPGSADPVCAEDRFTLPRSKFRKGEGSIGVMIQLAKTGYVPGEPVNIQVSTDNQSTKQVKAIYGSIHMRTTVDATEPDHVVKVSEKRLSENRVRLDSVAPKQLRSPEKFPRYNQTDCLVYIPAVSPNIRIPGLLETEYFVHVEVVYSKSRPPICMHVPIVVGTVPIVGRTHDARERARQDAAVNRQELLGAAMGGPACSSEMFDENAENRPPLPSYADVTPSGKISCVFLRYFILCACSIFCFLLRICCSCINIVHHIGISEQSLS